MNELVLGGIYLTPNDNYLVVVDIDDEIHNIVDLYNIAFFTKNKFNQKDLQVKLSIPKTDFDPYFIEVNSDSIFKYFANGYCGKVHNNFHKQLREVFKPGSEYFNDAEDLDLIMGRPI